MFAINRDLAASQGGSGIFLAPVSGCLPMSTPTTLMQDQDANLYLSWLRVSGTSEGPQIDQCVGHQFHPIVPLLFELEAQQQPLEFVFALFDLGVGCDQI